MVKEYRDKTILVAFTVSLDVGVPVLREPQGRIFADPRSCFSFRFEIANVALHSMRKCNSHIPA
jgi:hypothetical protein